MIDTTPKYPKEHVFLDGALKRLLEAVYDAGWYDHSACADLNENPANWYLFEARLKLAGGDLTRLDVWEQDGDKVKA